MNDQPSSPASPSAAEVSGLGPAVGPVTGRYEAQVLQVQRIVLLTTAALYSAGHAAIGLTLMLAAVVAEAILTRRLPWRRNALDPYLLAFIGVFIVSGLFSAFRSVATGSALLAALAIYLSYGPLYRVLADDHGFVRPFFSAWFAGGVAAAVLALFSFSSGPHLQIALPALGSNGLGSTFLIALVLGVGLVLTLSSPLRYVVGAGVLIVAAALAITLSRGAWIGAAAGLIALFLLSWRRRLWPVILSAVVAIVLSLALFGGEGAVLRKKVVSIVNPTRNKARLFLARSALAIAADHPLIGSGLNTFVLVHPHPSVANDPYALKRRQRVQPFAHNVLLNMAAEGGLLGLGSFVALLIRGCAAGWRWHRAVSGADRALSAAALAMFVGLLTHQLFDGTVLSVHIGAGLWFLLATMVVNEPRGVRGGPPP